MTADSIRENDVLSGRGGLTNNHVGNKRFRAIVVEYQAEYLQAKKKEKAIIAHKIVERVMRSGGRFLRRDNAADIWVEVPEKKAVAKTSQALREGLDVRHKSYRPEKMPRRDSDSSTENPRKLTRLVKGKVADAPMTKAVVSPEFGPQTTPDLLDEQPAVADMDPMVLLFAPPPFKQSDCHDVAAV